LQADVPAVEHQGQLVLPAPHQPIPQPISLPMIAPGKNSTPGT
jgi:hypothetical protein